MAQDDKKQKTVVIGAGPVGALAALYAAQRGHDVEIYELRSGTSHYTTFASCVAFPCTLRFLILSASTFLYFKNLSSSSKLNQKLRKMTTVHLRGWPVSKQRQ